MTSEYRVVGTGSTGDYCGQYEDQETNSRIMADAVRFSNSYEISELFMKSANAVLYMAKCKQTGKKVLMKQLPKVKTGSTSLRRVGARLVPPEVYFNFAAYHPGSNIVKPLDYFERKTSHVLVMEYVDSVDLFELIKRLGALNPAVIKIILRQLIDMWSSLDRAGICHRDIKDENIIVNLETLECKLIDFGCATEVDHSKIETSFSGTPEFYPPEYYLHREYTHDSLTAWNIGCVVYTLFAGDLPFHGVDKIIEFDICADPLLDTLTPNAANLLIGLLNPDPSSRVNFRQARDLAHDYLNEKTQWKKEKTHKTHYTALTIYASHFINFAIN